MIKSRGEKTYQLVINIILVLTTLLMVLPLLLLFMSSITEENTLIINGYSLFPAKLSLESYQYILYNSTTVFRAYGITIIVTLIGTTGSLLLSSMTAFPLSIPGFRGKRVITFIIFFTMLFNGGLVPSYIMWTSMFHIKNTIWAYILPNFLMSAFNVILIRTFFATSIPNEIYESASIDGAGYFRIYGRIVIPLGKPILIAIGLFTGLAYWNDWTNGLYYISDSKMMSVQTLLNKMVTDVEALAASSNAGTNMAIRVPQVSIRMAIAFVAIVPILVLYPFLQKYFAKGIALGAVKG